MQQFPPPLNRRPGIHPLKPPAAPIDCPPLKCFNITILQQPDDNNRNRRRWPPPRWVVHIALAWFIVITVISLLLETTTGPWWWVTYHALTGGNAVGGLVYGNAGAYLIAEEIHMIISHLNNLKDQEIAAERRQSDLAKARAEAHAAARAEALTEGRQEGLETGRHEGLEEGRHEIASAVSQLLTPEQLDALPPDLRSLLNRYSNNGDSNGAGP